MKTSLCFSLMLFGTLLSTTALAANHATTRDMPAVHADQVTQQGLLEGAKAPAPKTHALSARTSASASTSAGAFGGTNGPYANPFRAYPPSCVADPLPTTPTGPTDSPTIDLAAYMPSANNGQGGYVREQVTVTFWRIPCSSSSTPHSVTLMRIQRRASNEGRIDQYPVFPGVRIQQGDIKFDDTNNDSLARLATEPNTVLSATSTDSAVVFSTTYVLENYAIDGRTAFDFNAPFKLRLDNFFVSGTSQYVIDVPAYNPTRSTYPDAYKPLPINGYMSSDYYDSTHSGEGAVVQVFERPDNGVYQLEMMWFTYGPDGKSFWLTGGAVVQPGDRVLDVPLFYRDNGGFAGDFGAKSDKHPWGSMTLQFSSCNDMYFTYESQNGLPTSVPQGSGTRTWARLANVNGLTCE